MSIFGTIIKDVKSFAAKVEAAFKKLFAEAPSIFAIASGVISYLGPIVVAVVTEADAAAGSEIATVLGDIKTKLATAAALVSQLAEASSITAVLSDIQADITTFLSLFSVSDAATVTKVTAWTTVITQELSALIEGFAAA